MSNLKHLCILLILMVVSATVAGCCCCMPGSPATTTTATPTPKPGAGTATPAPTQAPTPTPAARAPFEPKTTGDLFDYTKVHTVGYKASGAGTAGDTTVRIEYLGRTTYNGAEACHMKWYSAYVADGKDAEVQIEVYQDPVTKAMLGGHMKTLLNGQVFLDQPMTPVNLEHTSVPAASPDESPLVKVGTEKVAAGGRTYDCTKYSATDDEGTAYYWVSPDVPFPVKYEMPADEGTYVAVLTEWS